MNPAVFLLLVFIAVTTRGCDKNDQFQGRYEMTTNPKEEKYDDVLKCMEYSREDSETIKKYPRYYEHRKNPNNNTITATITIGGRIITNKYEFGKEFKETLFDGRSCQTHLYCNGTVITEKQYCGNFYVRTVIDVYKEGMCEIVTCKDTSVVLKFKRLPANVHLIAIDGKPII